MTNFVPLYGSLMGYAIASQTLNPKNITKEQIEERIKSCNLKDLQFYNPDSHFALLSQSNYIKNLLAEENKKPPITQSNPIDVGKDYNHKLRLEGEL